jgi:hypothetical protein
MYQRLFSLLSEGLAICLVDDEVVIVTGVWGKIRCVAKEDAGAEFGLRDVVDAVTLRI